MVWEANPEKCLLVSQVSMSVTSQDGFKKGDED